MQIAEEEVANHKRSYTIKNVFQDLNRLLLNQDEIISNTHENFDNDQTNSIMITLTNGQQLEMRILQIMRFIIYIFVQEGKKPSIMRINSNSYLRQQVSNTYIKPGNVEEILPLFQTQRKFKTIIDVIQQRIKKSLNADDNLDVLMNMDVLKYLDMSSLLKLLSINYYFNQLNKKNEFWFQLFIRRYGKTGFNVAILQWKLVYLGKLKKSQKEKWK